jgi:ribonuclease P protein component
VPYLRAAAPAAVINSRSATKEPSGLPNLAFPRASRILKSADFRVVYDNGIRVTCPIFAAFCLQRKDVSGPRIGLTVPRALGGAVIRNRIKRRIREAFRHHRAEFAAWDIVINPRRAALTAPFGEIERGLQKVIEKCGH